MVYPPPRTEWARLTGGIAPGVMKLALDRPLTGWQGNDLLAVVPTARGDLTGYDEVTVEYLTRGNGVILNSATLHPHPTFGAHTAEVLNLTRNCRIEGTPTGRAHVFIRSTSPQALSHVSLRNMGPRKDGLKILGRWPLHFHHSSAASVVGAVARNTGSHAFVAHLSHGTILDKCIAHDVEEHAFWSDDGAIEATDDITWQDCVASKVSGGRTGKQSGFYLHHGQRDKLVRGVAVSCSAGVDSPGACCGGDDWTVAGVLSHNNNSAFSTYYNASQRAFDSVTGYHCETGLSHGAYRNSTRYTRFHLSGVDLGIDLAAVANQAGTFIEDTTLDVLGDWGVYRSRHFKEPAVPTVFRRVTFTGHQRAAVGIGPQTAGSGHVDLIDLEDCTFSGNELWLDDACEPGSLIRIRGANIGNWDVRRKDQPGTFYAPWNAARTAV